MLDWYILLVPLAVLPMVLLLAFVGCQLIFPVPLPPIEVSLVIAPGCVGLSSLECRFTNSANDDVATATLAPIPAEGTTLTVNVNMDMTEEGTVGCDATIKSDQGETFELPTAHHDKIEDELVEPFTLFCILGGGFELS